jgi:hypothetical protein
MILEKMVIDKMTLDKMTFDKMKVDKMTVNKMTCSRHMALLKHFFLGMLKMSYFVVNNQDPQEKNSFGGNHFKTFYKCYDTLYGDTQHNDTSQNNTWQYNNHT